MNNWQPIVKDVNESELKLVTDYGIAGASRTYAHLSEGDTLFVRQSGHYENPQHVWLDRHEFYNLIFNFMSFEELVDIVTKRAEEDFKKN